MKAVKGNKAYTITEVEVKSYQANGFDIYDDKGKLKESGAGKKITPEQYEAVKKENAKLKKELEKALEKTPATE